MSNNLIKFLVEFYFVSCKNIFLEFQTCDNSGVFLSHACLTGDNYEKHFYQRPFRCWHPFWT